jgi:hypothetical protein
LGVAQRFAAAVAAAVADGARPLDPPEAIAVTATASAALTANMSAAQARVRPCTWSS